MFRRIISFFAGVLVLVMVAGMFFQEFLPEGKRPTDWFNKTEQEEQLPEEEVPEENGGAMITEGASAGGLKLMSESISPEDYADYGVQPLSESAYTLTAVVEPESASNQKVNWSMAFATSSGWASGKVLTDYVNLSVGYNTKTATVSCKAPFGTQIIVTAASDEDSSISATCTLDYAQKIKSASLNIGNISVVNGGNTNIKYEIAPSTLGMGGAIEGEYTTSDVYTVQDSFSETVYLEFDKVFELNDSAITGVSYDGYNTSSNLMGKELYYDFDHDISHWMIVGRVNDILFSELTTEDIAAYFDNITQPVLYSITYKIVGNYSSYTFTSNVVCSGYTTNTSVNSVKLTESGYVF